MAEGEWANGEVFISSQQVEEIEEPHHFIVSPARVEGVSNLRARASSTTTIELYWELDLDAIPAGANIQVEQALASDGIFSVIGTIGTSETSFIATGLAAGTLYCFRVTVI